MGGLQRFHDIGLPAKRQQHTGKRALGRHWQRRERVLPRGGGETLECGYFFSIKNQNEPTYAWSFPSEDAYVIAIGDANSTFAHLESWWLANADPNASPSPSAP